MTEFSRNKLYDHVPDPYYSGAEGFELVLDLLKMLAPGCWNIVKTICLKFGAKPDQ